VLWLVWTNECLLVQRSSCVLRPILITAQGANPVLSLSQIFPDTHPRIRA
jgi:hypothetical protein